MGAVVYALDWQTAGPAPVAIIEAACAIDACRGVLFDTWGKSNGPGIDLTWQPHVNRVQSSGRFVALAGSLDAKAIRRLAPSAPEIFAVRGSACAGGDRLGPIDPGESRFWREPLSKPVRSLLIRIISRAASKLPLENSSGRFPSQETG